MPKLWSKILIPFRALSLNAWLVIVLLLIILVAVSTCSIGNMFDRGKVDKGDVVQDQKARDNASASRLEDTLKRNDNTEKLNEVSASFPDSRPSDRRLALECQRMRNNGTASLPSFCGPPVARTAQP